MNDCDGDGDTFHNYFTLTPPKGNHLAFKGSFLVGVKVAGSDKGTLGSSLSGITEASVEDFTAMDT